jgi:hypothetical protein
MKVLLVLIAGLLSAIYFTIIYFLILGTILGECFRGRGHFCPTDHERNVRLLTILIGGIALYLAVALGIRYLMKRRMSSGQKSEGLCPKLPQ